MAASIFMALLLLEQLAYCVKIIGLRSFWALDIQMNARSSDYLTSPKCNVIQWWASLN